jgi:putative PIN family toxin of toxin-antitoxin system
VLSATADSNVFISALNYPGAAARLLGLARAGIIRIDTSEAILSETVGVLRDKFGWEGYRLHFAKEQLRGFCNVVQPSNTFDILKDDPDDNRVLECAEAAGSEYVVTGDQDLLRLKQFGATRIITVIEPDVASANRNPVTVPGEAASFQLLHILA